MALTFENIREIMTLDPFDIKKSLVELIDKNLGIKNPDTYEAGFLGYLTQAQTLLTSDVLFNNAMAWNEAFTHLLALPTSLQNHANMLDYNISSATPCEGYVTVYVPFPENNNVAYQLTIKNGTNCTSSTSSNKGYIVKDTYLINASATNPKVQKKDAMTGIVSDLDINIEVREGIRYLIFNVTVWQIRIFQFTEAFTDVQYKEFYDVNIGGIEDQFHSINIGVYMRDDNYTDPRLVKFEQVPSIYGVTSRDRAYTFKYYGDGRGTIRFGNGVFGLQPKEGSTGNIVIYTTKGMNGIAYPGQVELDLKLMDFYTNSIVNVYGTNTLTIDNGVDEEHIETAKANIISHISSAQRLVTKEDYYGYEGITGIKNLEVYPMLLRRDTNVNEIDLFSVLYDNNGMPIPTTNLSYIIDKERTILSKDYVYKLAIKYGENGVELVPNVMKIINNMALDPDKRELYSAIYIDSSYDNYDPIYQLNDRKIIYMYSDNKQEVIEPDEIKEFLCPFNISIENKDNDKVGIFEYIPHLINDIPKIEDQIEYADVDMNLNSVLFEYLPSESMRLSNIKPTHINVINNMSISTNVSGDLVKSYVVISQEGHDSQRFDCVHKYISNDENEMATACMIPINMIYNGEFLFEFVLYYGDKYYNTYKRYITFINSSDLSLTDKYIGFPLSFSYDPTDPRTMPSLPAIDKVYIGITNVKIEWASWKDDDNFNVDGYIVDVELNKLSIVDINKIQCKFFVGYGLNEYQLDSIASFNDTMVTYRFKVPYNPLYILNGSTYYQIKVLYQFTSDNGVLSPFFTPFATYGGFAIFRKKFSELMWCNIETIDNYMDEAYKIYRIPVVDKQYYENNKESLENDIFYQLALHDGKVIDYKMLTDRMNFKFAKTIGTTENLKYNDRVKNIDESLKYHGWTIDVPPTIKLSILVNRDSLRAKQEIVTQCKEVVVAFLQLKANFNARIVRSELKRFIHDTIPEIISCEIVEPSRDIIYFYSENELPRDKDTLLSYNPEFIWIDINKIYVDVVFTPA